MLLLKKYESYSDFRHSLTINKNIYIYIRFVTKIMPK